MRSIVRRVLNARRDFMLRSDDEPTVVYMGPDDYIDMKQEMADVMMLDLCLQPVDSYRDTKIAGLTLKLTPYNGIVVR